MGHYTGFTVELQNVDIDAFNLMTDDGVINFDGNDFKWVGDNKLRSCQSYTFYNHKEFFLDLSKKWRGTFKVMCVGEDGDKWVDYFRDGKSKSYEAIYPPLIESDLE